MKINIKRVRLLLAEQRINQTELAARMGVPPTFVSLIMGRGSCSMKTLVRIAAGLDVPAEELMLEG